MAQESVSQGTKHKTSVGEKVSPVVVVALAGGTALYLAIGGLGTLVGNNHVSLRHPLEADGNRITYEERLPATGFWGYFPFVDKDGHGITTVKTLEGGLVARIIDNNRDGIIGEKDIVEVVEEINGVRGTVSYQSGKVVDSDGKTEFAEPSTVLQARIIEQGRQERAKWSSWLQTRLPEIKAKLQELYGR